MKNDKKTIYKLLIAINFAVMFFCNAPFVFADEISINLRIETATSTIFNGPINAMECSPAPDISSTTSAYCAIGQASTTATWNAFGDDYFLDSINAVANDFGSNLFWLWFSNLELGSIAMNKHVLVSGENLLVTIGKMPMKIEVSTTTPLLNSTTTVSILQFGFDSSFNPIYFSSATSTLMVNGYSLGESVNGVFDIFITSTSTLILKGTKNGFIDTAEITLIPYEEVATSSVVSTEEETPPPSPSGGGGGGSIAHQNLDVSKATQFLISNQKEDGSFGNLLYTDWAAMALSSTNEESLKFKLKNYFLSSTSSILVFPDHERHAMALMALGINPYNGTPINYIEQIGHRFDGVQIGDKSLVNDDIFAIFPLVKSGFDEKDPFTKLIISFILSKQQQNGSWENSIDLTASAIQAISLTPSLSNVTEAKIKAKLFLKNTQQQNGGWGNSFSTSWVMQAIAALSETRADWNLNGSDPGDYLYSIQLNDGGIGGVSDNLDNRIWATSYAILGSQGKTWGNLLQTFVKQAPPSHAGGVVPATTSGGGGVGSSVLATEATTSAISKINDMATSTATSTEIIINNSISTLIVATGSGISDKSKNIITSGINKNFNLQSKILVSDFKKDSLKGSDALASKQSLAAVGVDFILIPLKTVFGFIKNTLSFFLSFI